MIQKRIVLLANSRKHSGRCLAGMEWHGASFSGWIRPISARPGEEISEKEREYEDGSDPRVLDVIDVPVLQAKPHACQTENWLIDPGFYWEKVGVMSWDKTRALAETPAALWLNGDGTYSGINDQITQQAALQLNTSICLIHVPALEINVCVPGANFGDQRKRVQGRFYHNGAYYALWISDPIIERKYLAGEPRVEQLGECLLTVSLSEPHPKNNGGVYHYKLIAAVIQKP